MKLLITYLIIQILAVETVVVSSATDSIWIKQLIFHFGTYFLLLVLIIRRFFIMKQALILPKAVLLFLVFIIIKIFLLVSVHQTMFDVVETSNYLSYFIIFLITFNILLTENRLQYFIRGIVLVTIVVGIYAVLQTFDIDVFKLTKEGLIASTMGNPNSLMLLLILALLLAFKNSFSTRIIDIISFMLLFSISILLTLSLKPYGLILSAILSGLFLFFILCFRLKALLRYLTIAVLVGITFVGIYTVYPEISDKIHGRMYINKIGIDMIQDRYATGGGGLYVKQNFLDYQKVELEYNDSYSYTNASHIENSYIEVAVKNGIIGLIVIIIFIVMFLIDHIRILIRRSLKKEEILNISITFCTLLIFLFAMSYSFFFDIVSVGQFFFVVLGISYYLLIKNDRDKKMSIISITPAKATRYVLISLTVLLLITSLTLDFRFFLGDMFLSKGKDYSTMAHHYYKTRKRGTAKHYYQKAIQSFTQAEKYYYRPAKVTFYKGVLELNLKNYDRARELFFKSIKRFSNPGTYINIGNTYLYQEKYDSAIQYYKNCLILNPTYATAYSRMALAHFGKHESYLNESKYIAEKELREAIKLMKLSIKYYPESEFNKNMLNLFEVKLEQLIVENNSQ